MIEYLHTYNITHCTAVYCALLYYSICTAGLREFLYISLKISDNGQSKKCKWFSCGEARFSEKAV